MIIKTPRKLLLMCMHSMINSYYADDICVYRGIREHIKHLSRPYYKSYGVDIVSLYDDTMRAVCKTWEHFSGDLKYPISHPTNKCSADAYNKQERLTYFCGEYGRRRIDLLEKMVVLLETPMYIRFLIKCGVYYEL